jgi:hypothetical protein
MLTDGSGLVKVLGQHPQVIELPEPIALGHKVALQHLAAGAPVVKYGVIIGRATCEIRAGQWVHLHNCASYFDERSQSFEVHTGATTDTRYE